MNKFPIILLSSFESEICIFPLTIDSVPDKELLMNLFQ